MVNYKVRHLTHYDYSEKVSLSHSLVTCQPRNTEWQTCLSNDTWIEPQPQYWVKRRDARGNWIGYFSLEHPHSQLSITCRSLVSVMPRAPLPGDVSWELVAARTRSEATALAYLYPSPWVPQLESVVAYGAQSFLPGGWWMASILDFQARIHRDFRYLPGSTAVHTPLLHAFQQRRGVCQDFAHIMVAGLRGQGLAARYVSGYLLTTPPPGQARLLGADASHAWVSCWLPDYGWVDFDPTNNCLCDQQHVVLAWGRDYSEVAPVRGVVLGGGSQAIQVSVDVLPQGEWEER